MPVDHVIRINGRSEPGHSTQGDTVNADRSGNLVLRFKAGAMPWVGPGNPSKSSLPSLFRADGSRLQPSRGSIWFSKFDNLAVQTERDDQQVDRAGEVRHKDQV